MQIKGIPSIQAHGDECTKCGLPVDEICTRCGCDCDNKGGLKAESAYCKKGCAIIIDGQVADNAVVFAADEADAAEALATIRESELEELALIA